MGEIVRSFEVKLVAQRNVFVAVGSCTVDFASQALGLFAVASSS
jgi:uncharacterized protein (DUF2345 family)